MGAFSNPLTGSGWGQQNQTNPFGGTNPIAAPSPVQGPFNLAGSMNQNPGGYRNFQGPNEIQRNIGLQNITTAGLKNKLAPQLAQLFGQYGTQAGQGFQTLANLGSPFYQQKQQQAFTQGVNQNQNAEAMARQQLGSQGYGSTPSGATAAMIGGMNQQGAQDLASQYLQNLFQNEQLQLGGLQGLAGVAGMFNPQGLLTGNASQGGNMNIPQTFFQDLSSVLSGIGDYAKGGAALGA